MDNNDSGPNNPYAPPSANLDEPQQGFENATNFVPEGLKIRAGVASDLYGEAWRIFMREPWMWIAYGLIFSILCALTGCIPVGGQVLAALLFGGFMITCAKYLETGTLEIGDMFAGFQIHGSPLAIFGLIQAAFVYVIHGPFMVAELVLTFSPGHDAHLLLTVKILSSLTQMIGALIVALSNFAGPALIVFHGFTPFEAFKTSIAAWFKNWTFGLLLGILSLLVIACGIIACCVGVLAAAPICVIASFLAYRAVFLTDSGDNRY